MSEKIKVMQTQNMQKVSSRSHGMKIAAQVLTYSF